MTLHERPVVQTWLRSRERLYMLATIAWLSILRAPWCGLTLPDLHALAADSADAAIWTLLSNVEMYSDVGQQRIARIVPILAAALAERGRYALRDWVERCWLSLGGPATLSNEQDLDDAEAYFARLEELDMGADLVDVTRLDAQLTNLFARPRPSNARVEIMTLHKSKGLEFDTVILPSLERGGGRDQTKLLRWARVAGLQSNGLVLAPSSARGADSDPIYHWLKSWEQRRATFERGRQLYVAATRARRHLHLLGSVGVSASKEGVNLKRPKAGCLLALLWPSVADQFAQTLQQAAGNVAATSSPRTPMMLRRLPLHWQPPKPDSITFAGSIDTVTATIEQPEFDWVGETGRHIGTVCIANLRYIASTSQASAWRAEGVASIVMTRRTGCARALRMERANARLRRWPPR